MEPSICCQRWPRNFILMKLNSNNTLLKHLKVKTSILFQNLTKISLTYMTWFCYSVRGCRICSLFQIDRENRLFQFYWKHWWFLIPETPSERSKSLLFWKLADHPFYKGFEKGANSAPPRTLLTHKNPVRNRIKRIYRLY